MSDFDSGRVRVVNQVDNSLRVNPLVSGSATGVLAGVQTTIVTFTGINPQTAITQITVSGTDYAKFQLYKNATLIDTRRGGPDRTIVFEFSNPLSLLVGEPLDVKVTHGNTGVSADFESTIYGV
jgi:hypothetical protein